MKLLLKCNSVAETKSFYEDVLGFRVSDNSEATCTVENEDGVIIFSVGENLGDAPYCAGTVYFYLDDVDGYYNQIKDQVIVAWPLQNMSYGTREFGIKDVNGYYLAFAQK